MGVKFSAIPAEYVPDFFHSNIEKALTALGPFQFDQDDPEDADIPYSAPWKFYSIFDSEIRGIQGDSWYAGQWKNTKRHGRGEQYWVNKSMYIGYYKNNRMNGKGRFISNTGAVYEGEFLEGKIHGEGKYFAANGDYYEGEFVNGRYEGYGILKRSNGKVYEGIFKKGIKHGDGHEKFGVKEFMGEFEGGELVNNVEFYGARYRGEGKWTHSLKEGKGQVIWENTIVDEGIFVDMKLNGFGVKRFADGSKQKGMFKLGRLHGIVLMMEDNGRRSYEEWNEGLFVRTATKEEYKQIKELAKSKM